MLPAMQSGGWISPTWTAEGWQHREAPESSGKSSLRWGQLIPPVTWQCKRQMILTARENLKTQDIRSVLPHISLQRNTFLYLSRTSLPPWPRVIIFCCLSMLLVWSSNLDDNFPFSSLWSRPGSCVPKPHTQPWGSIILQDNVFLLARFFRSVSGQFVSNFVPVYFTLLNHYCAPLMLIFSSLCHNKSRCPWPMIPLSLLPNPLGMPCIP